MLPHEPLQQPTFNIARAARSNAVQQAQQNHSFGGGAAPPFVPWRGWDELESIRYPLPESRWQMVSLASLTVWLVEHPSGCTVPSRMVRTDGFTHAHRNSTVRSQGI